MNKEIIIKILGIITARGGSKRIINKNMKLMKDKRRKFRLKRKKKPLIQYTFDAVKKSKLLNRCIVSTDDDNIIEFAKEHNIEVPFKRPEYLATDTATSLDVLIHAVNFLKEHKAYIPDYVMILQPTTPLRKGEDIDNCITLIRDNPEADYLVSVTKLDHTSNPYTVMELNKGFIEFYDKGTKDVRLSQKDTLCYKRNCAIYIIKTDVLLRDEIIVGKLCLPYIMPNERSIDIDEMYDWKIAEMLMRGKASKRIAELSKEEE